MTSDVNHKVQYSGTKNILERKIEINITKDTSIKGDSIKSIVAKLAADNQGLIS